MKRIVFFLIVILFFESKVYTQAPTTIKYQAVVRDTVGQLVQQKFVRLRIILLCDSINGTNVYSEIHGAVTNKFGLVNISIGGGQVVNGDFNTIDWSRGGYFIRTELDVNGGLNFKYMGISQLLSVPYANYAASTGDTSMWKKDSADIYYKKGNVGIGTECPTEKLHVSGGMKIDDGTQGNNKVLTSDASGKARWSSISDVNRGFGDPSYPDGTDGIVPLTISVNFSNTFTVPSGKNLYILNLFTMSLTSLMIDGIQITHGYYNSGSGNFSQRLSNPIVVGPGQVVGSSNSNDISINGYLVGLSSSGQSIAVNCGSPFTDSRDGNRYNTVLIGDQCWMAENLAYLPYVNSPDWGSSELPAYYVYDYAGTDVNAAKATNNYSIYGVLYNWPAAMDGGQSSNTVPSGVQGICPDGWHLPSDEEWKLLEGEVDSQFGYPDAEWDNQGYRGSDGGGNMKEIGTTHWSIPNAGATNISFFTALPAGRRINNIPVGVFVNISSSVYFWTSNGGTTSDYYYRTLSKNSSTIGRFDDGYDEGFSVRCLKD